MRRLPWRRYQTCRTLLLHARDVAVMLAAILGWVVVVMLVA